MGFRGPPVSPTKPPGTFRVILLGGSTAVGYGTDDDATIDAYLRRMLAASFPGICVEVVNLALGGYDSYQDYERMRVEGARLDPDLVIIHSGINDVRNARYADLSDPPDPRTLLWQGPLQELRGPGGYSPNAWAVIKHYSYVARLPGFMRSLWGTRRDLATIRATDAYPAAVDYFATNLERTIDLAVTGGAAVILSTPPSALSFRNQPTDPVEKSYWIRDAVTTEDYRSRLEARMRKIARHEQETGRLVIHVSHRLRPEDFLDDAHLLGSGNEAVARGLRKAADPFVRGALPLGSGGPHACRSGASP